MRFQIWPVLLLAGSALGAPVLATQGLSEAGLVRTGSSASTHGAVRAQLPQL